MLFIKLHGYLQLKTRYPFISSACFSIFDPHNSAIQDSYVETWNYDVIFTFTNDAGELFDLIDIDLGYLFNPGLWTIEGFDAANSLVASINADNSMGASNDFSSFTSLASLTIQNNASHCPAFDNVTFSPSYVPGSGQPPVPEPATMLLLGIGIVGLAGFRKKMIKK